MSKVAAASTAALASACLLLPLQAAGADSVLFNPIIDNASVTLTGTEARLRFHPRKWDSSLSANFDEGNVGTTAEISNDLATLLNTEYAFSLSFEASTKIFTWVIDSNVPDTSVITVVESDHFNAIRFNARSIDPAITVSFSGVTFTGLPGSGTWRPDGSASNRIDGQRVVAESGLLSDSDWSIGGYVSADGTTGSNTKIWIATQNAALLPAVARPVPEPSSAALLACGLVMLGWGCSRKRRTGRRGEPG